MGEDTHLKETLDKTVKRMSEMKSEVEGRLPRLPR